MRILDRYLLREYAGYCLLGVVTFVSLFVVVDLFEKLDIFVDHKASLSMVARYYGYAATTILTQVLPVAILLGTLLSLGQLKKFNEVTAMQSAGQSPWRLAAPLLVAALLVSIGQYALNELLEPRFYEAQKKILQEEIKKLSGTDAESRSDVRLLGGGRRLYTAQFYDSRQKTLRSVQVQVVHAPSVELRIDAEKAVYSRGRWVFENGFRRAFADSSLSVLPFRTYVSSAFDEPPEDFARRSADPFHIGMRELWRYASRLRESGVETQKYMTNFHLRASFPLANLILTLLGAGLSLRVIRGGGLAMGIGISVSIGFAYFAMVRVGQALGYNGTVPPAVAAWLGNAIFLAVGAFLFARVSR